MLSIGLMSIIGAGAGAGIAWLSQGEYERTANLIRNPGFESKDAYWGSGYLEDGVRNLRHRDELEKLPYVVSPNPEKTKSNGRAVSTHAHTGRNSFQFEHKTERRENHFGSLSQRIYGLRTGTNYIVTFWLAFDPNTEPDAFFITTDYPWSDAHTIRNKDALGGWQHYSHRFNSGALDYADIRFVIQAPGTIWLDDVDVRENG